MSGELLEHFEQLVEEMRSSLSDRGVSIEFHRSPTGRQKTSLGVYFQLKDRGGFLTIWDTGECQLSTVDYASGVDPDESLHSVNSDEDLTQVMDLLLSWVQRR